MKKITSKAPITFRVDGNPGGDGTVLKIDEQGCITDDRDAAIVAERLGENVQITDISAEDAKKEAKKMAPEQVEKTVRDEMDSENKTDSSDSEGGSSNDEKVENDGPSLGDMKRADLDAMATEMGIDPSEYSNADQLREAIASKSK